MYEHQILSAQRLCAICIFLSQNHRMAEVGRDLCSLSGPPSLPKQGHLKQVAQAHGLTAFEYLQAQRINKFPVQPVPVLSHPHSEKMFPDVQREPPVFQLVLIASGPVPGHHREEPGSALFAPSLQVFMYIDEIALSLLFSRLNSPSSLSLSA